MLLEEVQFLAGKDKTQDELVYTLDALADAGKRVVFTGRMAPSQLQGLAPALVSRLADSVTVGIEPPDFSTRVRILRRQAAQEGIAVPQEVLEFLAQEIPDDVRRLRSALVGLMARSSLTGRPLDLGLAAEVLGQLSARLRRVSPRADPRPGGHGLRPGPEAAHRQKPQKSGGAAAQPGHVPVPPPHRRLLRGHRPGVQPRPRHGDVRGGPDRAQA